MSNSILELKPADAAFVDDFRWADDVIRRFYDADSELYRILIIHSYKVAEMASEVLQNNPEIKADRHWVYRAAMLHDIGIIETDAPGIYCHGTYPYICHGYLGGDMLRSIGLDEYALVAERHTGTGLTAEYIKEKKIPLPEGRIYTPQSIEEQIICYSDKFYSKTKLHTRKSVEQIEKSMSKWGDCTVAQFKKWHHIFSGT